MENYNKIPMLSLYYSIVFIMCISQVFYRLFMQVKLFVNENRTYRWYLGDNCIVFENFTASIGDLMVANWVYWRRYIDAVKLSNTIQLSPFECNPVYRCSLPHYWQDDVSGNKKISHVSTVELIPWKLQHCPITNQEY